MDIICDQFFDFFFFFHQKLESTQYNAALALTHEVRGTFRENLYQDWDWNLFKTTSLQEVNVTSVRRITTKHLITIITKYNTTSKSSWRTRNADGITAIIEWNKLDLDIGDSASVNTFKKNYSSS